MLKRKAILLIDFQNEFLSKGGKLNDKVSNVLENTNMMEKVPHLVEEARDHGAVIIHSPIVVDPNDPEKDETDKVMNNLRAGGMFEKGSWNAEIIADVQPEATDYVLQHRRTTSVFRGTLLAKLLRREKIDVLFIVGLTTDGCVLQAVQEAYDALYGDTSSVGSATNQIQIIVLSDGTASSSNKLHMQMITEVIPEYCDVATVDYAKEMLIKEQTGSIPTRPNTKRKSQGFSIFDPIKKLRIAMVEKWLPGERVLRFLDSDGDGMVTYQEFHDFLHHFNLLSGEFDPKLVFDIMDLDGVGEISTEVVVESLKATDDDVEEDPDADRMDILNATKLKPFPSPFLVSLVAHNNMKPSMMKFVKDHITFFSRVKLVTTGSTGRALKSLGLEVAHLVASGPLGGDQEIGGLIAQGKVCAVFFFVDPLSAHPHAPDIEALNRICCVQDVMFANNPSTAQALVYSLENSSFGYSCLCGVNPEYQLDSTIVMKYKENQQKVIANVSADNGGKKAGEEYVVPISVGNHPGGNQRPSIAGRPGFRRTSVCRTSIAKVSSSRFLEVNAIPEFIGKRMSSAAISIPLSRMSSAESIDSSFIVKREHSGFVL